MPLPPAGASPAGLGDARGDEPGSELGDEYALALGTTRPHTRHPWMSSTVSRHGPMPVPMLCRRSHASYWSKNFNACRPPGLLQVTRAGLPRDG